MVNEMDNIKGKLYLVSTPIGNLKDITLRAIETLQRADIIAAEDTRHTLKLLNHLGITKKLMSLHEHNENIRVENILEFLDKGMKVALVSDAGTPGISDPGEILVREITKRGYNVEGIPGPTAAVLALSISGLPTGHFSFYGFLPNGNKEKKLLMEKISKQEETLILYESPHRLKKTLKDLLTVLGDRNISICRELTKAFEEVFRGSIKEGIEYFQSPKGEFTLVIQGVEGETKEILNPEDLGMDIINGYKILRDKGLSNKDIIKELSQKFGIPKNKLYSFVHEDIIK
jgi:16S rRNA (cytidine1402-2'-O)-methyltransferase